jgi:hypothetical protein
MTRQKHEAVLGFLGKLELSAGTQVLIHIQGKPGCLRSTRGYASCAHVSLFRHMDETSTTVKPFQGSAASKGIFEAAKCGDLSALQCCIAANGGSVHMKDENTL